MTTDHADGATSTRVADFVDGVAEFSIARAGADVELVQIIDSDGQPKAATFQAVDREDYPGIATVTATAEVGDGPHSIQVICAG